MYWLLVIWIGNLTFADFLSGEFSLRVFDVCVSLFLFLGVYVFVCVLQIKQKLFSSHLNLYV